MAVESPELKGSEKLRLGTMKRANERILVKVKLETEVLWRSQYHEMTTQNSSGSGLELAREPTGQSV